MLDYRVRGFTRDVKGKKHFIDHNINSIQNYLSKDTLQMYTMVDVNVYQENIFHTKMILKDLDLDNYLFDIEMDDLSKNEQKKVFEQIKREMTEIFYGRNVSKGMKL